MQWKNIFCAISLLAPLALSAQSSKITTNGRPLAMLEESESADHIMIASGSKVVRPDSLVVKTGLSPVITKPTAAPAEEVKTNPLAGKFKHVPLIGELDYYGNMNGYMVNYCKRYMNNYATRLKSANTKDEIFEVMEGVLQKHGIPTELKYLAVIESALNGNARSPVGAVGYWQFMAPTARDMGLTVNRHRDDRRNLYKSTEAAAKYLTYLYEELNDWLLVIAAYNSGPRPVMNAIKRTGKNDFWSIKKYLPKETQNHVLAFVATATIMERLNNYITPGLPDNFDWASLNNQPGAADETRLTDNEFDHPLLTKFGEDEVRKMALVRIDKPINLEVVAAVLKMDRKLLGRWNYDYYEYVGTYKSGNTYNFRIPKEKLDQYIENKGYIEKLSSRQL